MSNATKNCEPQGMATLWIIIKNESSCRREEFPRARMKGAFLLFSLKTSATCVFFWKRKIELIANSKIVYLKFKKLRKKTYWLKLNKALKAIQIRCFDCLEFLSFSSLSGLVVLSFSKLKITVFSQLLSWSARL